MWIRRFKVYLSMRNITFSDEIVYATTAIVYDAMWRRVGDLEEIIYVI